MHVSQSEQYSNVNLFNTDNTSSCQAQDVVTIDLISFLSVSARGMPGKLYINFISVFAKHACPVNGAKQQSVSEKL